MNSKNKPWKYIRTENTINLKLFKAQFTYFENPRNPGGAEKMVVLTGADSVNVVPVTEDEQMIFVRQFRVGIQDFTLELPGGLVDPGEEAMQAAHRELAEETGYTATKWESLGKIASNPVFMDSYIHHTIAYGVEKTQDIQLDDGEDIYLEVLPITEVKKRLKRGEFMHPHTVSALTRYFFQSHDAESFPIL